MAKEAEELGKKFLIWHESDGLFADLVKQIDEYLALERAAALREAATIAERLKICADDVSQYDTAEQIEEDILALIPSADASACTCSMLANPRCRVCDPKCPVHGGPAVFKAASKAGKV
jgi:hypothetical protein